MPAHRQPESIDIDRGRNERPMPAHEEPVVWCEHRLIEHLEGSFEQRRSGALQDDRAFLRKCCGDRPFVRCRLAEEGLVIASANAGAGAGAEENASVAAPAPRRKCRRDEGKSEGTTFCMPISSRACQTNPTRGVNYGNDGPLARGNSF
jgi:hypothetical protein